MRRRIVTLLLAPLAATVMVLAAPAAANATDYGVDMNQACQINHGLGWQAELTYPGQGAYGWRCWVPPWGVRRTVDVQAYCTAFGLGNAVILDVNNPYSWRCRT